MTGKCTESIPGEPFHKKPEYCSDCHKEKVEEKTKELKSKVSELETRLREEQQKYSALLRNIDPEFTLEQSRATQ